MTIVLLLKYSASMKIALNGIIIILNVIPLALFLLLILVPNTGPAGWGVALIAQSPIGLIWGIISLMFLLSYIRKSKPQTTTKLITYIALIFPVYCLITSVIAIVALITMAM
jgi:hypothetical protein